MEAKYYSWVRAYMRARRYGATVLVAARFAGIHRTVVYAARRNLPGFRDDEHAAEDEGFSRIGVNRNAVPYDRWPRQQATYRTFACDYCGGEIAFGEKYHRGGGSRHKRVHIDCAAVQAHHYHELQDLLRGDL